METNKINRVLMPTDFSELASSAFQVAIAICKRQNAELTILHVVESIPNIPIDDLTSNPNYLIADLVETYKNRIEHFSKKMILKTGVIIKGEIVNGNIADTICSMAIEQNFDLIVMGTHGTSGIREFFIGSNAFNVVKKANCPVLTIPSEWNRVDFKKVTFPVRESIDAVAKYNIAKPIIEKNNSSIQVLSLNLDNSESTKNELGKLVTLLKEEIEEDKMEFSNISLSSSKFPEQVIEHATNFDSDLIIITANLDYGFKAFFLGPYSQQIVNHSKVPVLSVKPKFKPMEKEEDRFSEIVKMMEKYGSEDPFSPIFS